MAEQNNGFTINELADKTETSRSTLINWLAMGRVDRPEVMYEGIQSARYNEESFNRAIEQIGRCKPLPKELKKKEWKLACTMTVLDHNRKAD